MLLKLLACFLALVHVQPALTHRQVRTLRVDTSLKVERTCEPVRVPLCRGLGLYNSTGTPDLPGFSSQQDAAETIQTYNALVMSKCSSHLPFLLCSVFVPMCSEWHRSLIGPCRPTCLEVKAKCEALTDTFAHGWPAELDCNRFPEFNGRDSMCMDSLSAGAAKPSPTAATNPSKSNPDLARHIPPTTGVAKPLGSVVPTTKWPNHAADVNLAGHIEGVGVPPPGRPSVPNPGQTSVQLAAKYRCLGKVHPEAYRYNNSTGQCQPLCSGRDVFTADETYLIDVWMGVWACGCFLSTTVTLITFLLDTSRVRFPERPIIFIAFSFNLHSLGYLVRLIVGREEISCDSSQPWRLLITGNLENTNCTVVFLLIYFFGLAGATWWAILCFCWLLQVVVGLTADKIIGFASFFHVLAWGGPAVLSISVVVLRDVSGEELTGLCFVGGANTASTANNLVIFVIGPLVTILVFGITCLVVTRAKAACRQRCSCETQSDASSASVSLTKVTASDGGRLSPWASKTPPANSASSRTFAVGALFVIPIACIASCYLYEHANRSSWYNRAAVIPEQSHLTPEAVEAPRPSVAIFMLKIFMWLAMGIICCLTVISDKSAMQVWTKCIKSPRGKNSRLKAVEVQRHYVPVRTDTLAKKSPRGPEPPFVYPARYEIPVGCDV